MKRFNITVNGKAYDVAVEELGATAAPVVAAPVAAAPAPVAAPAVAAPAPVAAPAAPVAAPAAPVAGSISINSPMPGTIVDVKVAAGQAVTKGQVLVVLEAMKMENDIVAPNDATVASVVVKKGDSVNSNDLLVTLG